MAACSSSGQPCSLVGPLPLCGRRPVDIAPADTTPMTHRVSHCRLLENTGVFPKNFLLFRYFCALLPTLSQLPCVISEWGGGGPWQSPGEHAQPPPGPQGEGVSLTRWGPLLGSVLLITQPGQGLSWAQHHTASKSVRK